MSAATAPPAASHLGPAVHRAGASLAGSGRLLRIELRHNAMLWLLPVAAVLFWYNGYREIMALPPMWGLRAMTLQNRLLLDLAIPVTGAAAWMGSREGRRDMTDLLGVTARPRWSRQLATWAATTAWAEAGCLGCIAVVYVMTARQAPWGGPLWWPAAVSAAGVPLLTAVAFAAGAWFPGRFVTPLVTLAVFFGLGFGTQAASGDHSYWQISPLAVGAADIGTAPGAATFYPYLPDLSIAQVMFTAGLTVAVLGGLGLSATGNGRRSRRLAAVITVAGLGAAATSVTLAGTGRLDAHGMIVIPALHDAASDQPVRSTLCSRTAIPVCVHPAYAAFLPAVTAAVGPELIELAGLPGAPARISQVPEVYRQGPGNSVDIGAERTGPATFVLPVWGPGQPGVGRPEFMGQLAQTLGLKLMSEVILGGSGSGRTADPKPSQAELAVIGGSVRFPASVDDRDLGPLFGRLLPSPGSPADLAARRFATLTPAAKHDWLAHHLAALRAGRISLAQLP
ncbi:MAG TPA: hypothetical protein VFQ68_44020 [Streptosporangiaceae bacterium]|nr:hypothetical protein [Streptosporangiaceae bacterium]